MRKGGLDAECLFRNARNPLHHVVSLACMGHKRKLFPNIPGFYGRRLGLAQRGSVCAVQEGRLSFPRLFSSLFRVSQVRAARSPPRLRRLLIVPLFVRFLGILSRSLADGPAS